MPNRSLKPAAEATLRTTRGWNPPVHALVNFQRAGVVNFGRASTGLGLGTCLLGMTGQAWAARLADQGQLAGVGALWVGRRP